MCKFLSLQAFGCVELNLKPESGLWPTPLAVDAFVLLVRPEILQLNELESFDLEPVDVGQDTDTVALGTIGESEPHRIGHDLQRLTDRQPWACSYRIRDLLLEAVFALQHVLEAREATALLRGLDALERGEDVAPALVGDVRARLGRLGVLLGRQPPVRARRPA